MPPVPKRGKIVLLHFVGQMPLAGIAWQAVHYLVGLEKLGYEAWYVEDHGANPYDPRINSVVMDCDYNVAYLRAAMERHGLGERWAYWDAINDVYHGLSRERVRALYAEADALINLCGATRLRDEHLRLPGAHHDRHRPGLRADQIRQGRPGGARLSRRAHAFLHLWRQSRHAGLPDPAVAACRGAPTRPPVDLDLWPRAERRAARASRRSRPGRTRARTSSSTAPSYLWSKHVNFLQIPRLAAAPAGDLLPHGDAAARRGGAPRGRGRRLAPRRSAPDLGRLWTRYRDFIAGSRGEFTVAKDIYVRPNSGWFSDRAVCYLAAGRPVVTMRTGFDQLLPGRARACSTTRRTTRRSPRSTRSPPIIRGHSRAARELARRIFRRPIGLSASCWRRSACELRHLPAYSRQSGLTASAPLGANDDRQCRRRLNRRQS